MSHHPYLESINNWGRIRGSTKTRAEFDYAHPDFRFCDVHNRVLDRMPQYSDFDSTMDTIAPCGCSRIGETVNEPIPPYDSSLSLDETRLEYKEAEEALTNIRIEPKNPQSVMEHARAVRTERYNWLAYDIKGHLISRELRKQFKKLPKEILEPQEWDTPMPVSDEIQEQLDAMSNLMQDKRSRSVTVRDYDPGVTYCHTHKCIGDGYVWRHPSRYRECGICWHEAQLSEKELQKQNQRMDRAPSDLLNNNVKYS